MNNNQKNPLWKKVLIILLIALLTLKGWDAVTMYSEGSEVKSHYMKNRVLVDGQEIYYDEVGSGSPTIVLLSGSGISSTYTDMYTLRKLLSKNNHVFLMDRFGMGLSSDTDKKRDADTLTEELTQALHGSKQQGPYLLVAHSMAGLQAIRFAQLHPEDTFGIVFVDAASPEFCREFQDPMKNLMHVLKLMRQLGLLRPVSRIPGMAALFFSNQNLSSEIRELERYMILRNLWNPVMINERREIQTNGEIVENHGALGKIPIRVISAGDNGFDGWLESQQGLLSLSADSTSIVLPDAGHFIHHEHPEVVVEEIEKLVQLIDRDVH